MSQPYAPGASPRHVTATQAASAPRFLKPTGGLLLPFALLAFVSASVGADPVKYPLGDIPLPPAVYQQNLKALPPDRMAVLESTLPPSYDARNEGIVTPAKNQGSCGSCWAFATVGAMESHLLRELGVGPENLSEQQQISCNTANYGCSGGYSSAVRYWEGPPQPDKGPIDESVFPYTASDSTACYQPVAAQMPYRVVDYHTVPTTTAAFKASLYENGPSYWRYDVYDDFYTYWGRYAPGAVYVNQGSTYAGGHAVLLIGWDDAKGAFLCKNSWGSGGPNGDGTFWIAYSGHRNGLGFGMINFALTSLETCTTNSECDDGIYCNGAEQCISGSCESGTPVSCASDGQWCNGVERCDEVAQGCISVNAPCDSEAEVCIEDGDFCQAASCGNGVCEIGEDCHTCGADCISGTGGGTEQACVLGVANGICNPRRETAECIDCAPAYCCGDGVCNGEENGTNCALDCGSEPVAEICDNNIDDDGDLQIDCDDTDCATFSGCEEPPICAPRLGTCDTSADCCSGRCLVNRHLCL